MIVLPTAQLILILEEMVATGNVLDACHVRLFENDISPTPSSVLADFTEPAGSGTDFPGYAPSAALVWAAPFVGTDGVAIVLSDAVQFNCTGPSEANIFGYFLYKAAVTGPPAVPAHVVFAERFPTPIPVQTALSAVALWPRFTFGQ
jgi:hypothetical protein